MAIHQSLIHLMETGVSILWVHLTGTHITRFLAEVSKVFHHDLQFKSQSQACTEVSPKTGQLRVVYNTMPSVSLQWNIER